MIALPLFFGLTLAAAAAGLSRRGRWTAPAGVAQSLALLALAGIVLTHPGQQWLLWPLAGWGMLRLTFTALGGFLLVVTAVVFLAVYLFSPGYLARYQDRYDQRPLGVTLALLLGSIALILLAGDVVTFLIAWELMSVLSYITVVFDHEAPENPRAGYAMLGASELGFLMVLGAWLPLVLAAHSIGFSAIAAVGSHRLTDGVRWAVFGLSFLGFGVKAGLFPAMSWLPRAHPAAPAHASAVLSGAILNLGLYGIILTNVLLLPPPSPAAGVIVLGIGVATTFLGILYAATDTHIKRLLAHSSIENMGLVTIGIGAAMTFDGVGLPVLGLLAWIAALYQILNHSVYKTLLFLGSGAIDQATGELNMDHLGGLGRRLKWTGVFLLAGTMAIAAIPPFNGFVSEWLLLQSLLRSVAMANPALETAFALAGVTVALAAGLAATAFIRFYGMTFLGRQRSDHAARAQDVTATQRTALGLLAGLALLLGIAPTYVATGLARVAASLAQSHDVAAFIPTFFQPGTLPPALASAFYPLGAAVGQHVLPDPGVVFMHPSTRLHAGVVFAMSPTYLAIAIGIALALAFALAKVLGHGRVRRGRPWLGGARTVDAGLTYTATGVARPIWVVFRAVLSPGQTVDREEVVAEHFRVSVQREDRSRYVVDRLIVDPSIRAARALAHLFARMHRGSVNAYVGYAFVALLAAMLLVRIT